MTTDDIIQHIFYHVATSLSVITRCTKAELYPSEPVKVGILFALKGSHYRGFYRWLERDYGYWFDYGT